MPAIAKKGRRPQDVRSPQPGKGLEVLGPLTIEFFINLTSRADNNGADKTDFFDIEIFL